MSLQLMQQIDANIGFKYIINQKAMFYVIMIQLYNGCEGKNASGSTKSMFQQCREFQKNKKNK